MPISKSSQVVIKTLFFETLNNGHPELVSEKECAPSPLQSLYTIYPLPYRWWQGQGVTVKYILFHFPIVAAQPCFNPPSTTEDPIIYCWHSTWTKEGRSRSDFMTPWPSGKTINNKSLFIYSVSNVPSFAKKNALLCTDSSTRVSHCYQIINYAAQRWPTCTWWRRREGKEKKMSGKCRSADNMWESHWKTDRQVEREYLLYPWNHPGWAAAESDLAGLYQHCSCRLRRRDTAMLDTIETGMCLSATVNVSIFFFFYLEFSYS